MKTSEEVAADLDGMPSRGERIVGVLASLVVLAVAFPLLYLSGNALLSNTSPREPEAVRIVIGVSLVLVLLGGHFLWRFAFTQPRAASARVQFIAGCVLLGVGTSSLLASFLVGPVNLSAVAAAILSVGAGVAMISHGRLRQRTK